MRGSREGRNEEWEGEVWREEDGPRGGEAGEGGRGMGGHRRVARSSGLAGSVLRTATALSEWRGRSASVADGSRRCRRRGGTEEAEVLMRRRGQRHCARTRSDSGVWRLRTET
jgi:hypothetical protein